jgi:DNA adenine methylase
MAQEEDPITEKITKPRPLIKWVGSKQRLLPELVKRLPYDYDVRRHVELFAGSAALFFEVAPFNALLADTNDKLIRMFRAVRNTPQEVLDELAPFAKYHCRDFYYVSRERLNHELLEDIPLAALFLYLNRTCYNGLWRENASGFFNVPMGDYKYPKIVDKSSVLYASKTLKCASLVTSPFVNSAALCSKDDFVYLDPPYDPISSTSNFTAFQRFLFGPQDQLKLAEEANTLSIIGAKVMLSNSDTPFIRKIYAKWNIETVAVRRSVSCGDRNIVNELIIRNY